MGDRVEGPRASPAAGQQVVRIVMDARGASGSVANFNWLEVR